MAIGPSKGVNPLNEEPLQTEHVALRMAQRHLTEHEIEYVMQYGIRYRRAGMLHFYLRKKDIPASDLRLNQYSRLEGAVVLLDSRSGTRIVTAYRSRHKDALKAIRWKAKYDRKRQAKSNPPFC